MRKTRAGFLLPLLWALGLPAACASSALAASSRTSVKTLKCPEKPPGGIVSAPTSPRALGRLANKCNQVEGQILTGKPEPMAEEQEVFENLSVTTGAGSAARFALGKKGLASLTMGSQSRFLFRPGVFSAAGEIKRFDFWIEFGKIRWASTLQWDDEKRQLAFGATPHEVRIETRAGEILLYGTDVYLTVERESGATILYVAEGRAEVTGAGRTVRVAAGQWTSVDPGEPPTPATGFYSSKNAGPDLRVPGDLFGEDPFFDLRNPRLNLPK